jgi:putative PIN family toxin of toxin-antitoxin system
MAGIRVVLDSNVVISGLIYPGSVPGIIVRACLESRVTLVMSRYILEEVQRVLPELKRNPFSAEEILDLIDRFIFQAELVEPDDAKDSELRDPADQAVLGTFRAGQAEYLITGEKDLLALADRHAIISPSEFWARHGG